ncbi:signal peptide peptidase SppA [Breoghania sp. L-A4]|uniref:signal peptide peptidase SppA n=1 Tax=Breoghania sp. L-A4 TaxID=2304600 RepID=UPI000E36028B|nr:signal peptide peptidase SppA [Breoghania sp. L-A4]AXS39067.1 signal peptide peptidase SppA [Breoghania sp. L-A4]
MTLDADVLVDRRRLRRKLTFWRVAAVLVLAGALIGLFMQQFDPRARAHAHIARLAVNGVILDDQKRLKMISRMAEDPAVKGLILSINSPGGSTSGGEGLLEALRAFSEKKPVVAHIGTVGASAGYMIAIAADHVVARRNAITGSIGVLFQFGDAEKLLETIGVNMDAVKSSPMKAEPTFYKPISPESRAMLASLVSDSYDWFVDVVADRRGMDRSAALRLADGSIYTGHQARELNLIDAIGGEETAKQWLVDEKHLDEDLPVLDWKVEDGLPGLPLGEAVAGFVGQSVVATLFGQSTIAKMLFPEAQMLDGLVSVWHARGVGNATNTGGPANDKIRAGSKDC